MFDNARGVPVLAGKENEPKGKERKTAGGKRREGKKINTLDRGGGTTGVSTNTKRCSSCTSCGCENTMR